eukprot:653026-Prorocentrum_minimum.AAC.2
MQTLFDRREALRTHVLIHLMHALRPFARPYRHVPSNGTMDLPHYRQFLLALAVSPIAPTVPLYHFPHPLFTPTVHTHCSHPLFTPTVHTHCSHPLFTPTVPLFTPTVHTHCSHPLFTPTVPLFMQGGRARLYSLHIRHLV